MFLFHCVRFRHKCNMSQQDAAKKDAVSEENETSSVDSDCQWSGRIRDRLQGANVVHEHRNLGCEATEDKSVAGCTVECQADKSKKRQAINNGYDPGHPIAVVLDHGWVQIGTGREGGGDSLHCRF